MSGAVRDIGQAREATEAELADWDRWTVDVAGGQVLQSRAWAAHRASSGWQGHHLVCDDGRRVLALTRAWPVIGGGRAYVPRGPVTAGDPPEQVARRVAAVTAWLGSRGLDVVTSDAELPVASGYGRLLHAQGYRPVDEIQPARHHLSLQLGDTGEEAIHASISRGTRQRIRQAEDNGLAVRRYDARAGEDSGRGFDAGAAGWLDTALRTFYELVRATGDRRGFRLGPVGPFLAWLTMAHAAGHAVLLEALVGGRQVIAGLLLYRHGDRLTTAISGDDEAARAAHPGALHLLRWRAIQLAIREGRAEMDLGGVDVPGARHEPRPGDATFGLYQHKRSFGAAFVEQVGAHELVLRPMHLAVAGAAARIAGRPRR